MAEALDAPAHPAAAGAVATEPAPGRAAPWRRLARIETFRSLREHPNFRLYWCGALTSNVGTWTQTVAQGWLVYQLTGSTFMLGVVGFVQSLPFLLFALYGGVLADRLERRRLMVWTQIGMMVLAFLLALLTLTGLVVVWHVLVIVFLNGIVNAFNTPVRQSIVSDLVPRKDLANAIAINSTQFQSSRTLGPALAGVLLAAVGPGWCFFLNGVSFVAVIWTLLVMQVPALPPRPRPPALQSVREALVYVRGHALIWTLLLAAGIPSLFGMAYMFLLPAFAETVLDAGPAGLGVLQSAVGIGALAGALTIASLPARWRGGATMLAALVVLGLALAAFGASQAFVLSVAALFAVGFSQMVYNNLRMTFVQGLAADEMRGRVLSLLTLATFGLQPLGAIEAGALAGVIGPGLAMLLNGGVCLVLGVLVWARSPRLRALQ
ncbi:MAG TPA: MFS transporter [Chloroflexota bacterium]|jgi:MFS family permease